MCHRKQAKFLEPLVIGWTSAIERYAKMWGEEDAAYYYNERANLSLLAGGAWISGWIGLEEFGSQKKRGTKKSSGRIDLYLSDSKRDIVVEAKQKWMSAACTDSNLDRFISERINLAVADAKCDYGAEIRIGCVFFVPRFSKRRFKNYRDDPLTSVQNEVLRYKRNKRADIWAWSFPKQTQFTSVERDKSFYPGVIMALKLVS